MDKVASVDTRQLLLQSWLTSQVPHFTMQPLAGDASFRRYYRVKTDAVTYIAMDAPKETENCESFIAIANALRQLSLNTPQIIAQNKEQGFLLLSDFGDDILLKIFNKDNAAQLYQLALNNLSIIKTCDTVSDWTIPHFTAERMHEELLLFKEWFLLRHCKLQLTPSDEKSLSDVFEFLIYSALEQPQVFAHRDYHSANLMRLSNQEIGILDFQDAFIGPVTYDLVSLLRDCYIDWPEAFVMTQVEYYWKKIAVPVSLAEFTRWFDLMGLQRHLKALLTFSRKMHRDNNSNYLQFIPRTEHYIKTISQRYPECRVLYHLFSERVAACVL